MKDCIKCREDLKRGRRTNRPKKAVGLAGLCLFHAYTTKNKKAIEEYQMKVFSKAIDIYLKKKGIRSGPIQRPGV